MKKFIFFLLLAGLASAFGYATIKAREFRDQALEADSIAAAADTAHAIEMGDSINAWQLRIVQTELQRDELDRELQARPVVRVAAGIHVDTLRITDTVQVVQEDTVEVYEFEGSDGPFAFTGDARLFPNRNGIFNVAVALTEPVPVDVTIHCQGRTGVRSASVLLAANDPFSVVPENVYQDPDICNPPIPVIPMFKATKERLAWAAGGAGFVLVVRGVIGLFDGGDGKRDYD